VLTNISFFFGVKTFLKKVNGIFFDAKGKTNLFFLIKFPLDFIIL